MAFHQPEPLLTGAVLALLVRVVAVDAHLHLQPHQLELGPQLEDLLIEQVLPSQQALGELVRGVRVQVETAGRGLLLGQPDGIREAKKMVLNEGLELSLGLLDKELMVHQIRRSDTKRSRRTRRNEGFARSSLAHHHVYFSSILIVFVESVLINPLIRPHLGHPHPLAHPDHLVVHQHSHHQHHEPAQLQQVRQQPQLLHLAQTNARGPQPEAPDQHRAGHVRQGAGCCVDALGHCHCGHHRAGHREHLDYAEGRQPAIAEQVLEIGEDGVHVVGVPVGHAVLHGKGAVQHTDQGQQQPAARQPEQPLEAHQLEGGQVIHLEQLLLVGELDAGEAQTHQDKAQPDQSPDRVTALPVGGEEADQADREDAEEGDPAADVAMPAGPDLVDQAVGCQGCKYNTPLEHLPHRAGQHGQGNIPQQRGQQVQQGGGQDGVGLYFGLAVASLGSRLQAGPPPEQEVRDEGQRFPQEHGQKLAERVVEADPRSDFLTVLELEQDGVERPRDDQEQHQPKHINCSGHPGEMQQNVSSESQALGQRAHGNVLTNAPNRYQVVAYVSVIAMVGLFYAAAPTLNSRLGLLVGFSVSLAALLVTGAASSLIDPTDPIIEQRHHINLSILGVLEQGRLYCDICRSYVERGSKHCLTCRRCTQGFDHHCKWINNCVGSKNYRWFIALIVALPAAVACYLALCGLLIQEAKQENKVGGLAIAVWVVGVGLGCFGVLDLNLLVFHGYLYGKGLTTYQWLIERTIEQERIVPKEEYDQSRSKSLDMSR